MKLEIILEEVLILSKEVGAYQLSKFRSLDLKKSTKSTEIDLVSEVDTESERLIVEKLKKLYPDYSILSEEGENTNNNSDYKWVIDPLDGTINYANGIAIFAISIALQYKGETILGVVYAPYLEESFYSIKGKGAFLNGKRLSIGKKTNLIDCVIGTGFPYDRASVAPDKNNINYFKHIMPKLRGVRRIGAAAYDLSLVAAGFLDGFWEMGLKIWDIAAASLIIQEAGGSIYHFREDRDISITAGNNIIANKLLEEIDYVNSTALNL